MKRNVAVVVAAAVLAVGVGLGAIAVTRAASAAPASAPLPVAYNGADGWHQGQARLPVIYLGRVERLRADPALVGMVGLVRAGQREAVGQHVHADLRGRALPQLPRQGLLLGTWQPGTASGTSPG